MADLIGIEVRGLREVQQKLSGLMSRDVLLEAQREAAKFLQGKLQKYPPQTYVSRKQAYGKTWFSDRQRRWFFAALRAGEIDVPYRRTRHLRNAWEIMSVGNDVVLVNDMEYAPYVHQQATQSRMLRLRDWPTVEGVGHQWGKEAGRIATQVIVRRIRSRQ